MAEKRMARSLREIANALENGVVGPSILREVDIFIKTLDSRGSQWLKS